MWSSRLALIGVMLGALPTLALAEDWIYEGRISETGSELTTVGGIRLIVENGSGQVLWQAAFDAVPIVDGRFQIAVGDVEEGVVRGVEAGDLLVRATTFTSYAEDGRSGQMDERTLGGLDDAYDGGALIVQDGDPVSILNIPPGNAVGLIVSGRFVAGGNSAGDAVAPFTTKSGNQYDPSVGNGWGDFALTNTNQGLAVGVNASTGDTRIWSRALLSGSKRIVVGAEGDAEDTFVIDDAKVGVGMDRSSSQVPSSALHVRDQASECAIGIQSSARHYELATVPSGRFQIKDVTNNEVCLEIATGQASLNGPEATNVELAIYPRWDANADILLESSSTTSWRVLADESSGDFRIHKKGDPDPGLVVTPQKHTRVKVLEITGGSDIAEPFVVNDGERIAAGSVVRIDAEVPGKVTLAATPYDRRVAGIVSGAGGVRPGLTLAQDELSGSHEVQVAVAGRVYVRADASYGAIEPGDLLTTSGTPGHAMRVCDFAQSPGAVIGKAMSRLDEGTGFVLALVTLQ